MGTLVLILIILLVAFVSGRPTVPDLLVPPSRDGRPDTPT